MSRGFFHLFLALCVLLTAAPASPQRLSFSLDAPGLQAAEPTVDETAFGNELIGEGLIETCDPGIELSREQRRELLQRLRISSAGRAVILDFIQQYGSLSNLVIQWDSVSYSQVTNGGGGGRAPASVKTGRLGAAICVHLARKLPDIEHLADLAHEMTHATRLEMRVLKGEVTDADEFVRARLTARGGEADAFSVECAVKRELTGEWDSFCSPYASGNRFETERVVRDLYNGQLSASLTGETYPVMLARQFRALAARKAANAAKNAPDYSALENKRSIQ